MDQSNSTNTSHHPLICSVAENIIKTFQDNVSGLADDIHKAAIHLSNLDSTAERTTLNMFDEMAQQVNTIDPVNPSYGPEKAIMDRMISGTAIVFEAAYRHMLQQLKSKSHKHSLHLIEHVVGTPAETMVLFGKNILKKAPSATNLVNLIEKIRRNQTINATKSSATQPSELDRLLHAINQTRAIRKTPLPAIPGAAKNPPRSTDVFYRNHDVTEAIDRLSAPDAPLLPTPQPRSTAQPIHRRHNNAADPNRPVSNAKPPRHNAQIRLNIDRNNASKQHRRPPSQPEQQHVAPTDYGQKLPTHSNNTQPRTDPAPKRRKLQHGTIIDNRTPATYNPRLITTSHTDFGHTAHPQALYAPDQIMSAMLDMQRNVLTMPEITTIKIDALTAKHSPQWAATHNRIKATVIDNVIENGRTPLFWTLGSPGAPDNASIPHPHPITEVSYAEADVLILTSAQHTFLLNMAYTLDKCVLIRETDLPPSLSLEERLQSIQRLLHAMPLSPDANVSLTEQSSANLVSDNEHQPQHITAALDAINADIDRSNPPTLTDNPPTNYPALMANEQLPPHLVSHSRVQQEINWTLSTMRNPTCHGYSDVLLEVERGCRASTKGLNQSVELIGLSTSSSTPHIDNYGHATYVTIQKIHQSWQRSSHNLSDSYELWPIIYRTSKTEPFIADAYQHLASETDNYDWIRNFEPRCPLLVLLTGDTLLMPPGTIHCPVSLTTSYITRGTVWLDQQIMQSLDFWAYTSINDLTTNDPRTPIASTIIRLLDRILQQKGIKEQLPRPFASKPDFERWYSLALDTIQNGSPHCTGKQCVCVRNGTVCNTGKCHQNPRH